MIKLDKRNIVLLAFLLFAFVASFSSYPIGGIKVSYITGITIIFLFVFSKTEKKLSSGVALTSAFILFTFVYAFVIGGFNNLTLFIGVIGSLVTCLIALKVLYNEKRIEQYFYYYILGFNISNVVVSVFYLYLKQFQYLIMDRDQFGARITGFFVNSNAFASAQLLVLPITVYFLITTKNKYKLFFALFFVNDLFLLVSSQSRSAYVGIVVSVIIVLLIKLRLLFFNSRRVFNRTMSFVILSFGVMFSLVIYTPLPQIITDISGFQLSRFNIDSRRYIGRSTIAEATGDRGYLVDASLKVISSHPFGIGFQAHEKVMGKETGVYKVSHNFILTHLMYYGIIFGLIWTVIWLLPIYLGIKKLNKKTYQQWGLMEFVLISYMSYIIYSLAHSSMNWVYLWILYVLLLQLISLSSDKGLSLTRIR